MLRLAVKSPTCTVDKKSATGSENVTFTCSVGVCGTASIPINIAQKGNVVKSGTNTITWQTTADDLSGTDVKCSADFGDPDSCPAVDTNPSKSSVQYDLHFKYESIFIRSQCVKCRQTEGTCKGKQLGLQQVIHKKMTLRHFERSRSWPRLSLNIKSFGDRVLVPMEHLGL